MPTPRQAKAIMAFFFDSERIDYEILRPLSHIRANWELRWEDSGQIMDEEDSFAASLVQLVTELAACDPPVRYHDSEDRLGEYFVRGLSSGASNQVSKVGRRWVDRNGRLLTPDDYIVMLEQGGFHDLDEAELVAAAAGRIKAAVDRGQKTFDQMERSHQYLLAGVMSVILYHRCPPNDE
jgi:hypothetical protein